MDKKVEIGKRLKALIEEKGWSKAEFARKAGIHAQDVNKYLSGSLNPTNLFIALESEGCDIDWLMNGKTGEVAAADIRRLFNGAMYPVVSHIRAGRGNVKTTYEYESKVTLEGPADPKCKGSLYFAVKGDSMEPRWEEGDYVLVNPKVRPKHGEYGVCCWDGEDGGLKKIFYQKDKVVLQSLNPNYPAVTIEKASVWFIGRVVLTQHKA